MSETRERLKAEAAELYPRVVSPLTALGFARENFNAGGRYAHVRAKTVSADGTEVEAAAKWLFKFVAVASQDHDKADELWEEAKSGPILDFLDHSVADVFIGDARQLLRAAGFYVETAETKEGQDSCQSPAPSQPVSRPTADTHSTGGDDE